MAVKTERERDTYRVKPCEASFFPATVIPWNRLPASAFLQGQDAGSYLLIVIYIMFLSATDCAAQRL